MSPSLTWKFECDTCSFGGPATEPLWRCPVCGSALVVDGLPEKVAPRDGEGIGLWRYSSTLPVPIPTAGTILGEGSTPLVPVQIDGRNVHLKLDSLLPTGSFKDRGAAVLARYLAIIDVRHVIVDSSGNAAVAMAAFAAAAGLRCTVYVPDSASPGKLVQARAAGAHVVPVSGSRQDVTTAAQDAAERDKSATYASHNYHAVFVEGVKTWALEAWEQLGNHTPAVVFAPSGGGSALVGAFHGFSETGAQMPRLIACQPSACAPMVRAVQEKSEIRAAEAGDTIAEGTRISMPSRPVQILKAIRESGGTAMAVDDEFLIDTLHLLWRRGIYVEPTAALGVAGCRLAIARGDVHDDDLIICHITGHGLKATGVIESLLD